MADAATTEMLRKMIGMPIPGLSKNKTEQTEQEQLNTELYKYLQQLESEGHANSNDSNNPT